MGVCVTQDPVPQTILERYQAHLVATGKSSHTFAAVGREVRLFGEWFSIVQRAREWTI